MIVATAGVETSRREGIHHANIESFFFIRTCKCQTLLEHCVVNSAPLSEILTLSCLYCWSPYWLTFEFVKSSLSHRGYCVYMCNHEVSLQ